MRSRIVAILVAACAVLGACSSSTPPATPAPIPPACVNDQAVYMLADTVRGVTPPEVRSMTRVELGTNPGATEAHILIDVDGRVTVEGVQSAGGHGQRQQSQVREVLQRALFQPAVRNGCAVRFRGSMKWETGVARPLLPN